jgi:site-specific recombinase XerD
MSVEKKFCLNRNGYKLFNALGDTTKRWFIFYYHTYENGHRKRIKFYGGINRYSDPEKRYQAAVKLLGDIESGVYGKKFDPVNLQSVFDKVMSTRARGLRLRTLQTYQVKVNAFIEYCANNRVDSLKLIQGAFATRFLNSLHAHATTINAYRNTLRTLFEDIRRQKLIDINPFADIKKLPESRRGKSPFNIAQVSQLKNEISQSNPVLWMACQLEYYCFIRPAEIRFLKVEDINLAEGFILVPGRISKNRKTQTVMIPEAFMEQLRAWISPDLPQNYYVVNRAAQPLGRHYLTHKHQQVLKKLGFSTRYSLYSWKHTGAIAAVKAGINLKSLQMQIRHHSLDQLNEYLREMGVMESDDIKHNFPKI